MYNQNTQKINPLLAGFLIAQVIFIALLAFTLPKLFGSNNITVDQSRLPAASLNNLNQYLPNLDDKTKRDVENALYSLILANTTNQSVRNSEVEATIIEDTASSLHFDRLGGINYFSAVIDIPDVEQSFDFYYGYPDDPDNGEFQNFFNILCPSRPEARIYPDFECNEASNGNQTQTHLDIAASFLPYYFFDNFSISISPSMRNNVTITPVNFDIDEATRASYIEETKSAVQILGFSPDIFTYHVSTAEDVDYTNE